MSYELGYELGYEGDWVEKTESRGYRLASEPQHGGYLMNGVGSLPPGLNLDDPRAVAEWLDGFTRPGTAGGDLGTGGAGGVGAPTGTVSPPVVAPGSTYTGANPVAPGAPDPNAPSGASSSAPVMSHDELVAANNSAEWTAAREDLAAYGLSGPEQDAFMRQYNGRSVSDLRSSGVLPPALPREGDPPHAVRPADADRATAAAGIRTRLRDDMVGDLSARIHRSMPSLDSDTCTSLAEQMYRDTTGVTDIGGNPPTAATIEAMGVRRADVDRNFNQVFPSGSNATTIATSGAFQSLNDRAIASERTAFASAAGPGFSTADSAYYGGANPNANQRGRRDRDARLYLLDRRIADNPGAIRRARTDPALAGGLAEFHRRVGNEGTTAHPSSNPSRRALEAALGSDPIDRSRLTADQRFQIDRADHEHHLREGEAIRAENVRATEATVAFGRNLYVQEHNQRFQLGMSILSDAQNRRRDEENNRRQVIGQMAQSAFNHGMQMTQSQIQQLNQLSLQQLQAMNQTTSALIQSGSPRPFDIVAQMLGGGGRR